jgi:hypothetical protein
MQLHTKKKNLLNLIDFEKYSFIYSFTVKLITSKSDEIFNVLNKKWWEFLNEN